MPEPSHEHHGHHDHDPREGHIPPPDLPHHESSLLQREKRILGFRPLHVILGGLVLVAILVLYLLLTARAGY